MTNLRAYIQAKVDLSLQTSTRGEAKSSESTAQRVGIQKEPDNVCPVMSLVTSVKLPSNRRLVILIPNVDVDEAGLSKAIRSSIPTFYANLVLVSLIHDQDAVPITRRCLASLAALIREPGIKVDTQIIWGHSWIKTYHKFIQDGDVIICPEGLYVSVGIRKKIRLCDWLGSTLNNPVYSLSGFFLYPSLHIMHSIQKIIYWVILLVFFVGFFLFEVKIESLPDNWLQKIIQSAVILGEVSLIYMWTSVMG